MTHTITRAGRMIVLPLMTAGSLAGTAFAGPFDIAEDQKETFLDLGGAVVSRAAYVGSEETDTNIFPYLAFEYEGRAFFNPAQGLGVNLINSNGLQVAATGYFASGRDAEDTPFVLEDEAAIEALDLDSSLTAGGLVSYRLPFAQVEVQAQAPVTGDIRGYRVDASLATRLIPLEKLVGEGTIIAPGIRASYYDDTWTESYYGLTQAQANAIGRDAGYEVGSGFNSYALFALTSLSVTDDITLVGAANYTILRGDAKDSPLSPDNSGLTLVAGIAKRF